MTKARTAYSVAFKHDAASLKATRYKKPVMPDTLGSST